MRTIYYQHKITGEITFEHKEAMEWYRSGAEVELWVDSPQFGRYQAGEWIH